MRVADTPPAVAESRMVLLTRSPVAGGGGGVDELSPFSKAVADASQSLDGFAAPAQEHHERERTQYVFESSGRTCMQPCVYNVQN